MEPHYNAVYEVHGEEHVIIAKAWDQINMWLICVQYVTLMLHMLNTCFTCYYTMILHVCYALSHIHEHVCFRYAASCMLILVKKNSSWTYYSSAIKCNNWWFWPAAGHIVTLIIISVWTIHVFNVLSVKSKIFCQNAGNAISETLDFKIFRGG